MKSFARHLNVAGLIKSLADTPVLACLLDEWQLPGPDATPTKLGLRLAVRAGYLNFYIKGQSVARLALVGGAPKLALHHKYVAHAEAASNNYVSLTGSALQSLPASEVFVWADKALNYAGEEKRFVDDLVAANPGVIDLEMALPGDARITEGGMSQGSLVSPRMDLVVLQDDGLRLAFWEAKCADNGELRASRDIAPHIVHQLARYVAWLQLPGGEGVPDRGSEVLLAYQHAAVVLVALAEAMDKKASTAISLWRRAMEGPLTAVRQPGVVICNYSPTRPNEDRSIQSAALRRKADSFLANGHKAKLEQSKIDGPIVVEKYAGPPTSPLPHLHGETISR